MNAWDEMYLEHGEVFSNPANEVKKIVPELFRRNVKYVLDSGSGTGRNANYLAEFGFKVTAVDYSVTAIKIAKSRNNSQNVKYVNGNISKLPLARESIDFIVSNHSLGYLDGEINEAVKEHTRVLKKDGLFLLRVASTEHPLNGVPIEKIDGFSNIANFLKMGQHFHFFDKKELEELYSDYNIIKLRHIRGKPYNRVTYPLREWLLICEKSG